MCCLGKVSIALLSQKNPPIAKEYHAYTHQRTGHVCCHGAECTTVGLFMAQGRVSALAVGLDYKVI